MSGFVKLGLDELQAGLAAVRSGEVLNPETVECIIQNAIAGLRQVRVGVSVFVWRDGKLLLGRRQGAHGAGTWGVPGGCQEYGETLEACALREVAEECGPQFQIRIVRRADFRDFDKYPPKQYVDCAFVAEWVSGEPKVMEPNKCDGWEWFWPDMLPERMFDTIRERLEEGVVSRVAMQDRLEALLWPALLAAVDYNDRVPRGFGDWKAWTDACKSLFNRLPTTELRLFVSRTMHSERVCRINHNPAIDDRLRNTATCHARELAQKVWKLLSE